MGAPAFWLPASADPLVHADRQWLLSRENQPYRLFGRLAPRVSISQAQAHISSVAEHLRSLHDPHSDWAQAATPVVWPGSPFPLPLKEYGGLTLATLLMMLAAVMVLVVACANVGSLQLARSRSRQNEMRIRMSLGARRLCLIRQLITESALVGALAGAVALLITWAMLKGAVLMMTNAIPGEYGGLVFDVTPESWDLQLRSSGLASRRHVVGVGSGGREFPVRTRLQRSKRYSIGSQPAPAGRTRNGAGRAVVDPDNRR